ncbi:acyl-CoA dehydrogenase family protein [Kitasatospora sp. NPDC001574]
MTATHEVTNQVPLPYGHDTAADPALLAALHRAGAGWAEPELHELGRLAGSEQAAEWGRLANEHPPVLRTHDRFGHRIDEVEFHPSWHELMRTAVGHGLHAAPWRDDRPGAHAARAAKFLVWGQVEAGHTCPVSMTYAAVAALRAAPALAAEFEPLLTSTTYDFGLRAPQGKRGLIAGMSMTEKQGGSDVRTNTTAAVPRPDGSYRLTGHKWFTSAPMSDLFLTLARAPGGLSCFLLPRVLPDGTRNRIHLQRLKDKLGNKSNASAEIEYDDAVGWLVGEEGRGVPTIIEMVNMTRLDCTTGAASGMRLGATRAVHHALHRRAFGRALVDQPLMRNVLADLVVESEAATTMASSPASAKLWSCSVRWRWTAKASSSAPSRSVGLTEGTMWPVSMQASVRPSPHNLSGPALRSAFRPDCIAAIPAGVAAGPERSVVTGSSQSTMIARLYLAISSIPPALVSIWPASFWPGSSGTTHGATSIGDCCQSRRAPRSVRKTPTRSAGMDGPGVGGNRSKC